MSISLDLFKLFDLQKTQNSIKVILLFAFIAFINYSQIFKDTGLLPPIVKKDIFVKELNNYNKTLESVHANSVYRVRFYRNGTDENNLHLMVNDSKQRAALTLLWKIVLPTIIAIMFWTFLAVCLYANYAIDSSNPLNPKKIKLLKVFNNVAPILFLLFALYSGINLMNLI